MPTDRRHGPCLLLCLLAAACSPEQEVTTVRLDLAPCLVPEEAPGCGEGLRARFPGEDGIPACLAVKGGAGAAAIPMRISSTDGSLSTAGGGADSLPLAGASFNALYQITTRLISQTEGALTTLVYTASAGAVATTVIVPFFWTPPDLEGWVLMMLLGVAGGGGHFALIKAFAAAPAATVSLFNYTTLLWAVFYGFLLFGDLPDGWTILGAAVIAASGLYIFSRERRLREPTDP